LVGPTAALWWCLLLVVAIALAEPGAASTVHLDGSGSAEPTLVRLCFWMDPDHIPAFAAAYDAAIAPLLQGQGLVPSSRHSRATVDSVYSRLYRVTDPQAMLNANYWYRSGWLQSLVPDSIRAQHGVVRVYGHPYSFPAAVAALPPKPVGLPKGNWRTFGVSDGLAGLKVFDICEDRNGDLWLATDGGLSRYDGNEFRNYTIEDGLPRSHVQSVVEDADGNIWVATGDWWTELGQGVARFDGEQWTQFTTDDGLASNKPICLLVASSGDLWIGGWGGVSHYDGERFKSFTPEQGLSGSEVVALAEDENGGIWTATWDGHSTAAGTGFSRLDGARFTSVGPEDGLPGVGRYSTGLGNDADGNLLLGYAEGGAARLIDGRFEPLPDPDSLRAGGVSVLYTDGSGDLWLTGRGGGLVRIHGSEHTPYHAADGLADDRVFAVHRDREGHIWFGTWGGLSRLDASTLVTFPREQSGSHALATCLLDDGAGGLWVGSEGFELDRFDGTTFQPYRIPEYLFVELPSALDGQGNRWFGCQKGAIRFDGTTFEVFTRADGLQEGQTLAFCSDSQGDLWAGCTGGLCRRGGDGLFERAAFQDELPKGWVTQLLTTRDGAVWIGTVVGLARFDGVRVQRIGADGLADALITGLLEDETGRVWIGTSSRGAFCVDGDSIRSFTVRNGLGHNSVWGMCQDRRGILWFAGIGGIISRYDGKVWQTLTDGDGLTGSQILAIKPGDGGSVWISTHDGLQRYQYPAPTPPRARIDAVTADRRYESPASVRVPSTTGVLGIHFSGHSMKTLPRAMVYRYRLSGLDSEWQTTRVGNVEYEHVPHGDYTFEVVAADRDLVYSEPATVRIQVHPPYERFAWIGALLLAGAAIVWQTTRVIRRDRRLHEANVDLTQANEALSDANDELFRANREVQETNAQLASANQRISATNTQLELANQEIQQATQRKSEFLRRMSHDLRTPMNAIIGYTRLVLRKAKDVLEPRQLRNLENIQSSAHNLLSLINEILDLSRVEAGRVEINLQEVDLRQLADACADEIASLVPAGVELRRELAAVPMVQTDPEILRKVLMNLLGNAVKFTEHGAITVAVAPVDAGDAGDAVEVRVSDTGVGIPPGDLPFIFEEFRQVERQGSPEKEGTGLGLAIAHKSVELLGGTLTAESEVGTGTTFILRVGHAGETACQRA